MAIVRFSSFFLCGFLTLFVCWQVQAQNNAPEMESAAAQVLLLDNETGTVLFAKQAREQFNPASLTKLMTAEVVFHAIEMGEISEETIFKVSEHAWRTGGAPSRTTTMFAAVNSHISVANLLQGLTVLQANDAALILAEGLAGSEAAFVERMNARAAELGMKNSVFFNATGLPHEENHTNAEDMALLARHIVHHHPQHFLLYAQEAFEWNKIFQRNRNPLFHAGLGVDGFVAAGTKQQGFSLITTVQDPQSGRRLFLVLNGVERDKQRVDEAKKLITWGISAFETKLIYHAGSKVAQAKVFGGMASQIALTTPDAIGMLLPKEGGEKLKIKVIYNGPLAAPLVAGEQVGHLVISARGGSISVQKPLFTAENVAQAGLVKQAGNALFELCLGWLRHYL